jgi:hypothetical protein
LCYQSASRRATTGYGYNADGVMSSVTYQLPSGAAWATTSTVNYAHDNADLLTGVTDFNGNAISVGNTAGSRQEAGPPPLEAVAEPVAIDGPQARDVIVDVVDVQRD